MMACQFIFLRSRDVLRIQSIPCTHILLEAVFMSKIPQEKNNIFRTSWTPHALKHPVQTSLIPTLKKSVTTNENYKGMTW